MFKIETLCTVFLFCLEFGLVFVPTQEEKKERTPFVPQRWQAVEQWPEVDKWKANEFKSNDEKRAAVERQLKEIDKQERAAKLPLKVSPNIKAKLIGVHDGDTITIQITVRLAEIDAPELIQPYGKQSRAALEERVSGGQLLFKLSAVDHYGRAVGYLQVYDSKSKLYQRQVNESMIRAGAVWWYKDYSDNPKLSEVEAIAREARLGLWEDDKPEAPWDFRKKKSRNLSPLQRLNGPLDRTVPPSRYQPPPRFRKTG